MIQSVEGELQVGEAAGAAGRVRRRILGPPWALAVFLAVMAVFAFIGAMVDRGAFWSLGVPGFTGMGWPLGMALGFVIGFSLYTRLMRAQFRRRLAARGQSGPFKVRLELGPEGLIQRYGEVERRAPWPAVTELFPAGPYWVFVIQGEPWHLPRRFFAGPEAERAFLAEALAHMTADARGRSREASSSSP
ncbi:hypothetical protein [Caulobacter sp. 17J65-9]|uniref:hypothetical protein n=1 Tax=Caulobacter sp. 17J65-9 TaxID=2709382 RepID=UPI0013CBF777|nr:hypothetical protein [Caulobacter sp. 17J65-9]NEX93823.1 hypothetical protein [Caulobacter sp. 17J65-9]